MQWNNDDILDRMRFKLKQIFLLCLLGVGVIFFAFQSEVVESTAISHPDQGLRQAIRSQETSPVSFENLRQLESRTPVQISNSLDAVPEPNLTLRTRDANTKLPVAAYVELRITPFAIDDSSFQVQATEQVHQVGNTGVVDVWVPPGHVEGVAWTDTAYSSLNKLELLDSRDSAAMEFELAIAGVVTGLVVDEQGGLPIQGAEICVPFVSDWNVAFSKPDGSFVFNGFPNDGSIALIEARLDGFHHGFARLYMEPSGEWGVISDGDSLEGNSGDWGTYPHVVLKLAPLASISGQVLSPNGNPVRDATVIAAGSYFTSRDAGLNDHEVTTTDENGSFRLSRLRAGISHSLLITAQGFAPWVNVIEAGPHAAAALGKIYLYPQAIFSGQVLESSGQPVYGIKVEFEGPSRPHRSFSSSNIRHISEAQFPGQDAWVDSLRFGESARTDEEGVFEVGGLAAEQYKLKVHWGDGVPVYEEDVEFSVALKRNRIIHIPDAPAIAGEVQSLSALNTNNVKLSLRANNGESLCRVRLSKHGRFRFPGLRANKSYQLWIEDGAQGKLIRSKLGTYSSGQESLVLNYAFPMEADEAITGGR